MQPVVLIRYILVESIMMGAHSKLRSRDTLTLPFCAGMTGMCTASTRKSSAKKSDCLPYLKILSFSDEEDDGSLARPPMRLFGRVSSQRSFISEDESEDSQFSGSGDSDDVGSDNGDTFGVQWSGGGFGGFTVDEEDDEEF